MNCSLHAICGPRLSITHIASGRDKAVAYNNMAVSYRQNGDEVSCERMYAAMLRADRSYNVDAGEREHPHHKRAFERAAPGSRRDQLLRFCHGRCDDGG